MRSEEQMIMLDRIHEMQFAAVELNLYLDNHPTDRDALNDYNYTVEQLMNLKQEYEKNFGPLLNFGLSPAYGNEWVWATEPWPWEE